jgi:hypothetical protein
VDADRDQRLPQPRHVRAAERGAIGAQSLLTIVRRRRQLPALIGRLPPRCPGGASRVSFNAIATRGRLCSSETRSLMKLVVSRPRPVPNK